jgi:hypothetical protein
MKQPRPSSFDSRYGGLSGVVLRFFGQRVDSRVIFDEPAGNAGTQSCNHGVEVRRGDRDSVAGLA